jgi:hypothetical protein
MAEYRRPFLEAGEDRWPTLQWAREVPLVGEPADIHDRIAAYFTWLKAASLAKLFIDAEPGVFITGRIRKLASSLPNQYRVVVRGLDFVQEDSPDDIGRLARTNLKIQHPAPNSIAGRTTSAGSRTERPAAAALRKLLAVWSDAPGDPIPKYALQTKRQRFHPNRSEASVQ